MTSYTLVDQAGNTQPADHPGTAIVIRTCTNARCRKRERTDHPSTVSYWLRTDRKTWKTHWQPYHLIIIEVLGRNFHTIAPPGRTCTCGYPMRGKVIKGTENPAKKCNVSCLDAVSEHCSCSCGGLNHGKKYLQAGAPAIEDSEEGPTA